jgi:hypothetical protein
MKVFGFDSSDPAGLQAALKFAQPIFAEVENRAFGIADTLLDRVDGAEIVIPEIRITLKLKPIPRAQPVT